MLSFGAVQGMLEPMTPLGRKPVRASSSPPGRSSSAWPLTRGDAAGALPAGERLWINLTPLLRNTVGRRVVPVITAWVDPAAGEALDAIWHDPRLQPARRGISPSARPGNWPASWFRWRATCCSTCSSPTGAGAASWSAGSDCCAVAAERCAAIQGEPRARLAQLARLRARNSGPTPAAHLSSVRLRRRQRHGVPSTC